MIDLENFDDNTKNEVKTETSPEKAHDVSGGLVKMGKATKMADIYDRFQKMVYVFDISDSMADGMLPGELDKVAYWTEEFLNQMREKLVLDAKARYGFADYSMKNAEDYFKVELVAKLQEELKHSEEEVVDLKHELKDTTDPDERDEILVLIRELDARIATIKDTDLPAAQNPTPGQIEAQAVKMVLGFDVNDDYALKLNTYVQHLDTRVGLQLVKTGLGLTHKRKIDTVKTAAKDFIESRLDKYPDADITVIQFGTNAKVISRKASRADLLEKIASMQVTGGTDIFKAVNLAVEECKARPANLAANHIILVTDGESWTVNELKTLVPVMKEKNIVLDLVFIKGYGGGMSMAGEEAELRYVGVIRQIAKETGGEVIEVSNAEALVLKLAEVSGRLLIPAKVGGQ
jgi:hypothetical protein